MNIDEDSSVYSAISSNFPAFNILSNAVYQVLTGLSNENNTIVDDDECSKYFPPGHCLDDMEIAEIRARNF